MATLLVEVREQQDALDDYILSADPQALERYREAVIAETTTAGQISAATDHLSAVTVALEGVDAENDAWRAAIAEPAIAAMQSGHSEAVTEVIQIRIQDQETSQAVTSLLLRTIDTGLAALGARSDTLNEYRVAASAAGVAIELLAVGLSLWFVRRYGLKVGRDARRRARASAERMEIVASLRTLRTQPTAEATAVVIAEALSRMPGVDVAGVFACHQGSLVALAMAGLSGFPIKAGETLPQAQATYLLERSASGPWAEPWIAPDIPDAHDVGRTSAGIRRRAFAPIEINDEVIGLIGVGTTDDDHARHLVEDLPAVGEFASVAETILAPALIARRLRVDARQRIESTIAAASFHPVFQPIVDLATGSMVGFEALTRFDDGSRPDHVFAAAAECGLGIELETVTLEAAIRASCDLAPGAWLSVNVSPALLAERCGLERLLAATTRPVVLEVTEHEAIPAYAPLRDAMRELGAGVRLAVDDAGAGVANFNHLVELRPSFVKIDAGLVRGVDNDSSRRAVVVGLIHFAAEAGCEVIAEGIETAEEQATVTELGVTFGQGFLLARPAVAEMWPARRKPGAPPLVVLPRPVLGLGPPAIRAPATA